MNLQTTYSPARLCEASLYYSSTESNTFLFKYNKTRQFFPISKCWITSMTLDKRIEFLIHLFLNIRVATKKADRSCRSYAY